MGQPFDPGYVSDPFVTLCEDYPGEDVYPPKDFRTEWGPIFHRGRLDGTARVLIIGQDPGAHESSMRRILVGEAGERVQGFLHRLGIDTKYVMVNAFLYSVAGQGGGNAHKNDVKIAGYRNRWLMALTGGSNVQAIVAFGSLADAAYKAWKKAPEGTGVQLPYVHLTHPTYPDSVAPKNSAKYARLMKALLTEWNVALNTLSGQITPEVPRALKLYGAKLLPVDHSPIPSDDLPAGIPAWMRSGEDWAKRRGNTNVEKRSTLVLTVPDDARHWLPRPLSPVNR